MKTYKEFIAESANQRVEGGYIWIEQVEPPSRTSTGKWKITVDGPLVNVGLLKKLMGTTKKLFRMQELT